MKKTTLYTEIAYLMGLLLLALGTALTEAGDFGISMVVAPAYLLHLKLSETLPFFSFGLAEYALQAMVLLLMMLLIKKIRPIYFLSFITTVIYGLFLDGFMLMLGQLPSDTLAMRLTLYIPGVFLCCAGIALLFRTYLPPEAYELFVKVLSRKWHISLPVFKTAYDICSMVIAIILSFAFFGRIRGIGIASVACAFINGTLIKMFTGLFERIWTFRDRFPLRIKFEESEETL